ncbi:MAG: hypothetical protein MZV70_05740 [Desulfobacterales bacterium]|nr:hypothetical protein [Desulfobacterales bacterium]
METLYLIKPGETGAQDGQPDGVLNPAFEADIERQPGQAGHRSTSVRDGSSSVCRRGLEDKAERVLSRVPGLVGCARALTMRQEHGGDREGWPSRSPGKAWRRGTAPSRSRPAGRTRDFPLDSYGLAAGTGAVVILETIPGLSRGRPEPGVHGVSWRSGSELYVRGAIRGGRQGLPARLRRAGAAAVIRGHRTRPWRAT